jgi:hypothetical protein
MAFPPKKTLTSWSWSRLQDYIKCPRWAKRKHLDKMKEPKSPAMERGASVADAMEQYKKGLSSKLPPEAKGFAEDLKRIRALYKSHRDFTFVEEMWGFDKDWKTVPWDDWNNCVVRIKLDEGEMYAEEDGSLTFRVTDDKTGKYRPEKVAEYMEQLELYCFGVLLRFPEVNRAEARLRFLDHDLYHPAPDVPFFAERDDLPRLLKKWNAMAKPLLSDTSFLPTPSVDSCRFCPDKKSLGGTCQY